MSLTRSGAAAGLGLLLACGGRVATTDGGAGNGNGSDDGGSGFFICPSDPPVPASQCFDPNAECDYYVDAPPWCEVRALCVSGAWQYQGDAGPHSCG